MMSKKNAPPSDFLWYALYAFAGLGLELVLLGAVEPLLFHGADSSAYTAGQSILHWLLTCLCWGGIAVLLVRGAKRKLGFTVLCRERPPAAAWRWPPCWRPCAFF
ncbi:MAG: hypothetical protein ACLTNY_10265 [Blautia massiliensis (ex Durand et al. 2017)]